MKACVLAGGVGDVSNFKIQDVAEPNKIGPNDVLIEHTAIGINFDDIMYRRGDYPIPEEFGKTPILGFEAVGNIVRKGDNVKSFSIGEQVGYAFCRLGAYAQQNLVDFRYVFSISNEISAEFAAGLLRKGLTAEYLLFKAFNGEKGDWILVHSAAGGVGHILCKWAKHVGLKVIGTVGNEEKISVALATGADFVINRAEEDLVKKVAEYTNGEGVRAIYDGIGKDVFEKSMQVLKPFGIYISYGYASGKLEPLDVMKLREKCIFFTAPVLELYKGNRYELICSAATVLEMLKKGILTPNISRYGLDGIPQAHADLESGKNLGSLVVNVY